MPSVKHVLVVAALVVLVGVVWGVFVDADRDASTAGDETLRDEPPTSDEQRRPTLPPYPTKPQKDDAAQDAGALTAQQIWEAMDPRARSERSNTSKRGVVTTGPVPDDKGERAGVVPGAREAPTGELEWDEDVGTGGSGTDDGGTDDGAVERCALTVTVHDADGEAQADVLVHVRREEKWETQRYALVRTNEEGKAVVTQLPASYYRVSIEDDEWIPNTRSWRCDGADDAVSLTRQSGDARIFGRVLEEGTGEPLAGATVTVQEITKDKDLKDFKVYTFVTVNEDGGFDFAVRGGNDWQFRLYAAAPGYEHRNADLFLEEQEQRRVTFSLRPLARVEGTVLSSSGTPVPGARVQQRGYAMMVGVDADAQGNFSTAIRPGAKIILTAYGGGEYGEYEDALRLGEGETRGGLAIHLRAGRTITGTVRTADNAVVPLAEVIVADMATGGFLVATQADAHGRFEVKGAPLRYLKAFATGSPERTKIEACKTNCVGKTFDVELLLVPRH
jgi:hypothetical protein